ncbi:hypothetical protein [Streptomyces sp. NPDC046197]|uniref:hypothetical protein n=1 Tax=Streptomyces sp. NPDC046197 TaxID=3154337 RepID=UPI0033F13B3C
MVTRWASRKRRYATAGCAAALVAALVWGTAALATGGTHGPRGADGAHGTHAAATTSRRWTPTPTAAPAVSAEGGLELRSAPNVFYLPRYNPRGKQQYAPEYTVVLKAAPASTGGGQGAVRKVEVALDLSAFAGKAEISFLNKAYNCVRSGFRVNCALGDLRPGQEPRFAPFSVTPSRGAAALGPAGTIRMTVRAAGTPTIRHTTRLVVGTPDLTARQDYKRLTNARPGDEMPLTPAFGNKGDIGIEGGISVLVTAEESTLVPRYGNCRYDKATGATRAQCDFPGPLPAGAAYETDGPVTAVVGQAARTGSVFYTVARTIDIDVLAELPESAPHGSGAPLRLRPVDGGAFTGDGGAPGERAIGGAVTFETTRNNDLEAVGFTIKGKVGWTFDVVVPYPKGTGWDGTMWVTPPEGVSVIDVPPGDHESDIPYCSPPLTKGGPAACHGPTPPGTVMRVHIDKCVEGAHGSVKVTSDPTTDPNQDDNSAPVTMEYVI